MKKSMPGRTGIHVSEKGGRFILNEGKGDPRVRGESLRNWNALRKSKAS